MGYRTPAQVSARELMGALAYCAIIAWCFAYTSASNMMVWTSLGACAFMSLIFVRVAETEAGSKLAFLVGAPVFACCLLPAQILPILSLFLLLNALLLFVVGIVCARRDNPLRARTLAWVAVTCNGFSIAVVVVGGMFALQSLNAMRARHPLVSYEDRLDYDNRKRERKDSTNSSGTLAAHLNKMLQQRESSMEIYSIRHTHLMRLHSASYEQFIRSIGFGASRKMRPRDDVIELPPLKNIPFDSLSSDDFDPRKFGMLEMDLAAISGIDLRLREIHEHGLFSFANPRTLGYTSKKRVKVAGLSNMGSATRRSLLPPIRLGG